MTLEELRLEVSKASEEKPAHWRLGRGISFGQDQHRSLSESGGRRADQVYDPQKIR